VWKKAARPIPGLRALHRCLGIRSKLLMERVFLARTEDGAIRSGIAGFRDFWAISAGFLTGFSAASPEN
jgi:hypothetical protein